MTSYLDEGRSQDSEEDVYVVAFDVAGASAGYGMREQ